MAAVVSLPREHRGETRGLEFWAKRVLEELAAFQETDSEDAVHDLRVALRRCRSLGAAIGEVDPHPAWSDLRRTAKKLFRELGALRDVHVQAALVQTLAPERDELGARLLEQFAAEEQKHRRRAEERAVQFSIKRWQQLARALRSRTRLVLPESAVAECLALERFEEARELHRRALRTEKSKPWHALRIGIKRFRYTTEALLPGRAALWIADLKKLQDLLGEVHDLDELGKRISQLAGGHAAVAAAWETRIQHERHRRIENYRRLTLGRTSLWNIWQLGLPHNGQVAAAADARLRATARAADPHKRRSAEVRSVATAMFRGLRRARASELLVAAKTLRVFEAAARLLGIQTSGKSPKKSGGKLVRNAVVPPGWTSEEWETLALVLHYQRGKEPRDGRGKFAALPATQQDTVRAVAGVLRIARALRKSWVRRGRGIRCENTPDAFVLRVPALPESQEAAVALAAAKHLLETHLGKPLLLKPARIEPSRKAEDRVVPMRAFAAAGD